MRVLCLYSALLLLGCGAGASDPELSTSERLRCGAANNVYVVAHPDDDLLFMNPDLAHAIADGHCVSAIYLTSGDAGREPAYWLGREAGLKAAYAQMAGVEDRWTAHQPLAGGKALARVRLAARPSVSLTFLRLPDGGNSAGYSRHGFSSLRKLWVGLLDSVATVDGASRYDKEELLAILGELMQRSAATTLSTLDPTGRHGHDHSDHLHSALFAFEAQRRLGGLGEVRMYRGYNISAEPANVQGLEADQKGDVMMTYAVHDANLCPDPSACALSAEYSSWLSRQYPVRQAARPGR